MGKSRIINAPIKPMILYRSNVLCVPDKVLKDINSIIFHFLWNGADKETRARTTKSIPNSGLGVPCISAYTFAAKANWIRKLKLKGSHNGWQNIFKTDELWKDFPQE